MGWLNKKKKTNILFELHAFVIESNLSPENQGDRLFWWPQ